MICFQVQHCKVMVSNKQVLEKQLYRSLCFDFMHQCAKKNNSFLARLPGISGKVNVDLYSALSCTHL